MTAYCVQEEVQLKMSSFLFIQNTTAEKGWQIESRELTVEHVVEDSVGGSDVFICLPVSKL